MFNFKKSLATVSILLVPFSAQAIINTAYVETNTNDFHNIGCYMLKTDGATQPFFDIADVFAANINGKDPNDPMIWLNPQDSKLLNQTKETSELKKEGIKVLVTLLNNHQPAGWSCMTDPYAAKIFANNIANFTQKYHLDGIDIDDEYAACTPNNTSMIMIAEALKENPRFKGKLLTKALWSDSNVFSAKYNNHSLADYLDYGWQMSYADDPGSLAPYVGYGMSHDDLLLGVSVGGDPGGDANAIQTTIADGYGGAMFYNITKNSTSYLNQVAKAEYGQNASVIAKPHCLK